MAESISKLMLRIGLSFDDLNKDFVKAESTLKSNMEHLSRENTLIKLRAQVDLSNVTDETQKLKIQQEALNKQLEIQKNRIQLSTIAWAEATQRTGEHSKAAQQTAIALEREKLKLVELEQELKKVAEQQKALPKADNSLVAGYKGLKSNISSIYSGSIGELANKFNELSTASQSADTAITKSLEIIGSIPSTAGKAVATLASLPLVLRGVENSIINYTRAAAASGDSVYVMSRGMQLSVAEMGKLSMVAKVTGIDINEVNSNLRRLETQFVKANGSENLMTRTLDKYNVKLTDVNGNLKKGLDLSLALADGLKKAQAEGKGSEFIAAIGGKFWSGDFVTYLEDLRDNIDAANKIVKNGLADPALAHQVQGNLNAMDTQAAQLKASFASVFLPVANEIVPRITERMGELTRFIADNKDEIKTFGEALAKFFGKIEDGADMAFSAIKILHDGLKKLRIESEQKELEIKYSFNLNPKDNFDIYKQVQESYNLSNPTYFAPMLKTLEDTKQQVKEKTDEIIKDIHNASMALEMERASNDNKNIGFAGASTAALERIDDHFEEKLEAAKAVVEKTREYSDELWKLQHDSYENQKYDVLKWQQDLLNSESTTEEQRVYIKQIATEKLKKIEEDRATKISDIIEQEERKYRTALENEIADAKKAKEEWIKIGMDKAKAEELAQKRINKAQEEAAKKAQEYIREAADIEYKLTHTAFENQLRDIERWKDAQLSKRENAQYTAEIIANAAAKEAEAFEREMDRIQGRIESAQDRLMRLASSQRDYDVYRAQKQYQQDISDGVPQAIAQQILDLTMRDISKRAKEDKTGKYTESPDGGGLQYVYEFGKSADLTAQSLAKLDSRTLAFQQVMGNMTDATMQNVRAIEAANEARQAELQNINSFAQQAQSGIEIIQGTESNLGAFKNALQQETQQFRAQAINQGPALQPEDFRELVSALSKAQISKDSYGTYGAATGNIDDLYNFIHGLQDYGVEMAEISSALDEIISLQQSRYSNGGQYAEGNVNVNPSITINIEGNADQAVLDEAESRIATKITDMIQSAGNRASSYGFAN